MRVPIMTNQEVKVFSFVLIIANYLMASYAGLWWFEGSDGVESGVYILVLYVLTYEFGYKVCYQRISKICFYLGFILPSLLASAGYGFGFMN